MEEKEKKTIKKATTTKKTTSKKTPATKKVAETKKTTATAKKTTKATTSSSAKKTTTKKTAEAASPKKTTTTKKATAKTTATAKKTTVKKPATKKTTTKKSTPKVTPETLEHTIIFDGLESQNISEVVDKLEEENVVVENNENTEVTKRSKAKKVAIIIIYILIIAIIIATIVYVAKDRVESNKRSETVNSDIYSKVSDNYKNSNESNKDKNEPKKDTGYSNIENLTLKSFEQKVLDKENFHVIIVSANCYYCAVYEETVNEVYKENKEKIYRIDIASLTDNQIKTLRYYYAFNSTPTIFAVKDGKIGADLAKTQTKEDLNNWVKENK